MNESLIALIKGILESDLPMPTRNAIIKHYMLPEPGFTKAIIQDEKVEVGMVERPDKMDIDIENNPKLKAEYEDTERLLTGKEEEE